MHYPKRPDWLIVERLNQELVIYNPATKSALCLDPTATRVFDLCDGQNSAEHIAQAVGEGAYPALDLLAEHELLLEPQKLHRRSFLRSAAVLAPLILSVTAPEPAWAASITPCVDASACNNPAVSIQCPGCDPANTGTPNPAQCANQNCLTFYHIPVDSSNNITSPNCAGDSPVAAVTCELTGPGQFWSRDCATSRAKVIAQWIAAGRPVSGLSNYKCCPACCTVPCP